MASLLIEPRIGGSNDVRRSDSDNNQDQSDNDNNTTISTVGLKDHERRFALDSVERDAGRVWMTLPESNRLEKDFVLAALKSTSLPPKSEFERILPQSLRFDRDVVLGFCHRGDFEQLYYTRHLFVPDCLMGDKEVMMAYCRKIPRALQECTEELCNDRDVVLAAISMGGLELQYASRRLQEDKDLVMLACQKDGRALEFCPLGPTRTELTSDRVFMLSVLGNQGGAMIRLVPEPLRRDRTLLLEALAHGMRFRCVPDIYKNDKKFLLKALQRSSMLYLEISSLQKNPEYALAAATATDSTDEVHRKALAAAPELKSNRDVIMSIALRGDKDLLESLFNGGGAQQYLDDKPLMLAAVKRDCRLFKYARARLREDPEVIMASIQRESAIDTLREISPEVRRRFPEISVKAIEVTCVRRLRYLESLIPEPLWQSREVVLAWIRKGGNVLEAFEPMLASDEEICLEVAKHNWLGFKKVGSGLRGDPEFMKKAVQRDGRVLRFANRQVQSNYQVVVRAVANHHRALSGVLVSEVNFKAWVKDALDLHMTFVKDFLRGIAISKPHVPPAHRSQLPMLDRGVETSQAFKQLIAQFLGVPVKDDLKVMRQAWTNMTYPPNNTGNDASDRDDYGLEDDMANIMAARRRDRWERRHEIRNVNGINVGGGGDREGGDRNDRAGRAAFRERMMAAHRRGAAAMFAAAAAAPAEREDADIEAIDMDLLDDEPEEEGLEEEDIVRRPRREQPAAFAAAAPPRMQFPNPFARANPVARRRRPAHRYGMNFYRDEDEEVEEEDDEIVNNNNNRRGGNNNNNNNENQDDQNPPPEFQDRFLAMLEDWGDL